MPLNLQEFDVLFTKKTKLEELYLDPIGEKTTMVVKYRGGSCFHLQSDKIVTCTLRGDLGSRPKTIKQKKRRKYSFEF